MKLNALIWLLPMALMGCATNPPQRSTGQFVMAGPVSAEGPVVSMRWQYALQLAVPGPTIAKVAFWCQALPGTEFVAGPANFKIRQDGLLIAEGPTLPMTPDATPWLFDQSPTSAQCRATISRWGSSDSFVFVNVKFNAAQKAAIVHDFRMAHDYNTKVKR